MIMVKPTQVRAWLITSGALFVAVLYGYAISISSLPLIAVLTTPFLMVAVLSLNIEQVLFAMFLSAMVVGGSAAYFARIGQALWLPVGIGAILYIQLLLYLIRGNGKDKVDPEAAMVMGMLFTVMIVVSTLWAEAPILQWVYGLRNYFGMASLLLVLALVPVSKELIEKLWHWLFLIVFIQLPVVLYQYIFVAGKRIEQNASGEAWDAVVGTMGGSQEGGGNSAALGFVVVSAFCMVLAQWKRRQIATWKVVGLGLCGASVIFLAEVKFMAILLPVSVMLTLRAQVLARIRLLVVGVLAIVVILVGMPILYSKLHYERAGRAPISISEFYEKFASSTDPTAVNAHTGEMGRFTQVVFWWQHHSLADEPKEFLLGHGVGATNISRLAVGDVARKYFPLLVGTNTGVLMLWEVGLLGLSVAICGISMGVLLSFSLSKNKAIPLMHQGFLEAGSIILFLTLVALFYKHLALRSTAVQFLLFLSAGQALYWRRRLKAPAVAAVSR